MFGDVAIELIKMMGASGRIPGAISAEDVAAASVRLRNELRARGSPAAPTTETDSDAETIDEPPIGLATRAVPLLDLLERAGAGNSPVMWEAG
jgi:hypothetical protein